MLEKNISSKLNNSLRQNENNIQTGETGDAYISEYVIPKNNVFWHVFFYSFLCVIKSFDGSFFKENFPIIPVWYNSNIRVGMRTLFIKKTMSK